MGGRVCRSRVCRHVPSPRTPTSGPPPRNRQGILIHSCLRRQTRTRQFSARRDGAAAYVPRSPGTTVPESRTSYPQLDALLTANLGNGTAPVAVSRDVGQCVSDMLCAVPPAVARRLLRTQSLQCTTRRCIGQSVSKQAVHRWRRAGHTPTIATFVFGILRVAGALDACWSVLAMLDRRREAVRRVALCMSAGEQPNTGPAQRRARTTERANRTREQFTVMSSHAHATLLYSLPLACHPGPPCLARVTSLSLLQLREACSPLLR